MLHASSATLCTPKFSFLDFISYEPCGTFVAKILCLNGLHMLYVKCVYL